MSVAAHPARDPTRSASAVRHGLVDLRALDSGVRAGTHLYEGPDLVTGWHCHDLHEIVYAFEGVAEVETQSSRYLLPPQRAMWIPAGLDHSTTLNGVRSVAVFFHPAMIAGAGARARVLGTAPVLREMMLYAARWPISRPRSDASADAFFDALALVSREAIEDEAPLCLPSTADPVASAVMDATQADLAGATSARVCASVGISERTLRRRFRSAAGMSWQQYLLASRLLRAMALLAERRCSVLEAALEVGFESASAFARAFVRFRGETPSAYRERVGR